MIQPGPVMLDLRGVDILPEEREMLRHPACGGVILFARNIEDAEQVAELNRQIREVRQHLLLAVDQEGGRVQRLRQTFSALPPLRQLELVANSMEEAQTNCAAHAHVMALETLAVGFDISFTPVLDLSTSTSRVIGDRAFHEDPATIAELASHYIRAMKDVGMSATGKHFPGHGTVDADSHVEIPVDDRSLESIRHADLVPFVKTAALLGGVMPAHVIYPQVDSLPAGFSGRWVKDILRKECQFDGVVFSDDLSMKGAEVVGDFRDRTDAALDAGCDMVLVCNHPEAAEQVLEHVGDKTYVDSSRRILSMLYRGEANIGLEKMRQTHSQWQSAHQVLSQNFD